MKCRQEGCRGTVNVRKRCIALTIGSIDRAVWPCNKCGRLHLHSGEAVPYFLKEGKIVNLEV